MVIDKRTKKKENSPIGGARMLPERLKELREAHQLSQSQIAIALKTNQSTYSNWENGIRTPNIKTLIEIADYYRISLDSLVGRENKK